MKEKTKTFILWGIGLALLAGIVMLVAFSKNNNGPKTATYSASVLQAGEKSFDFETISMKNGNVSHDFEIKNEGAESVVIEKVYTSCMCTTAMITDSAGKTYGAFGMPGHGRTPSTNISVAPSESVAIKAIFDPNAHGPSGVGLAQRSVYLETNSAQSPKLELRFQATVTR